MLLAAATFNIVPDPLFSALMILPFAVTAFGLHALLFKPYVAYIEGREQATVGAREEARQLQDKAAAALADLEDRLSSAREEAAAIRATARETALRKESEIMTAARTQAGERLEEALATLAKEREGAREEVKAMATTLSTDVAERVLGRSVAA